MIVHIGPNLWPFFRAIGRLLYGLRWRNMRDEEIKRGWRTPDGEPRHRAARPARPGAWVDVVMDDAGSSIHLTD